MDLIGIVIQYTIHSKKKKRCFLHLRLRKSNWKCNIKCEIIHVDTQARNGHISEISLGNVHRFCLFLARDH